MNQLDGAQNAGGKLKAVGAIQSATGLWNSPNTASNNSSGFSAIPGGNIGYDGIYGGMGDYGVWWSSSESPMVANADYSYYFILFYFWSGAELDSSNKNSGYSVRCLRD
jgi:uncharacterized protein (TIGR02145 family)